MNRVVVTGIGAVTPAGIGLDALWKSIDSTEACITAIDRFDAAGYACPAAGQADFTAEEHLSACFIKRTDRVAQLAVFVARQALADAGVTIGVDVSPERTGVMVGNVLGGCEFAERELRKLWTEGVRAVSPYQATACSPVAPQGDICTDLGIEGPARTFVADRASGAYAIFRGAETVLRGQADVVLAGGVDAPLSPYGWLCLETSGLMAKAGADQQPKAIYRPFDARHRGTVFGEGGAVDVALALRAMRLGRVPAIVNLERPAPGLDLDFVQGVSRSIGSWEHSLIVSRGLGGVNACLMVRR